MSAPVTPAQIQRSALGLLGRREYCCAELKMKLMQRFGSRCTSAETLIDGVLQELTESGLLSERRYVESLVRSRCVRGYGPQYIARELKFKGIGEDLVDEFLDRHHEGWLKRASELAAKKFAGIDVDRDSWSRTARFLQRRGFPSDIVAKAIGDMPGPI